MREHVLADDGVRGRLDGRVVEDISCLLGHVLVAGIDQLSVHCCSSPVLCQAFRLLIARGTVDPVGLC